MSDFTTTCPACDRTCPISLDLIRTWTTGTDTDTSGDRDSDGDLYCEESRPIPVNCRGCDTTFWIDVAVITTGQPSRQLVERLPPLADGVTVTVTNDHHPLANKTGTILGRKHMHYLVGLDVGDIWLPEHWVSAAAGG